MHAIRAVEVRMRVLLADTPVRRPARVPDPRAGWLGGKRHGGADPLAAVRALELGT